MWNKYTRNLPNRKKAGLEPDYLLDIEMKNGNRIVVPASPYVDTSGTHSGTYIVYGHKMMLEQFLGEYTILYWMDYPDPNLT